MQQINISNFYITIQDMVVYIVSQLNCQDI